MVQGDANTDRAYLDHHGVHKALSDALARVVREKCIFCGQNLVLRDSCDVRE